MPILAVLDTCHRKLPGDLSLAFIIFSIVVEKSGITIRPNGVVTAFPINVVGHVKEDPVHSKGARKRSSNKINTVGCDPCANQARKNVPSEILPTCTSTKDGQW